MVKRATGLRTWSAEASGMDVSERMATIGRARDEARRAIRYAKFHSAWPDDISPEAQEILARDPDAIREAQLIEAGARRKAAIKGGFARLFGRT